MIKVIPFIYDDYDDLCANSYVVVNEQNECIIIDPSKKYDGLVRYLVKNNLNLKAIFITHGHIDHLAGLDTLLEHKKVDVFISFDEEEVIKDSYNNCSIFIKSEPYAFTGDLRLLSDKEVVSIIGAKIVALATPYHTKGSMCYYFEKENILFTGDSLFKNGIGRHDLPTGNFRQIRKSLEKIFSLPLDTKVYPGHGKFTHLRDEKDTFKFV